jgi:hypothetical protein
VAATPTAPPLPVTAPVGAATVEPITMYPSPPSPGERTELFGVSRRLPRGAFLWPAGAVAALGLEAAASAEAQLPLAALELLAASAVADLGTWVAARGVDVAPVAGAAPAMFSAPGAPSTAAATPSATSAAGRPPLATTAPTMTVPSVGSSWDSTEGAAAPFEAAQRARFEAVYLALARSPEGVSMSPSARVARALSVMARGDETLRGTALERAAAAWSVLPVVIGGDAPSMSSDAPAPSVDGRPGLARLSAQAGDFLGSFVTPTVREIVAAARSGGVSDRAPSTDYVQVGSDATASEHAASPPSSGARSRGTFARFGGGEVEIPPWFEAAARSMFADRGGGGLGDGISLAELTLIAAAPPSQIAAATRTTGGPAAGTAAPGTGSGQAAGGDKPDVDALALEVYTEVLKLIDIARERNGEPYV